MENIVGLLTVIGILMVSKSFFRVINLFFTLKFHEVVISGMKNNAKLETNYELKQTSFITLDVLNLGIGVCLIFNKYIMINSGWI